MERLSKSSLLQFLARRPFSVVHIDADWDGNRKAVSEKIRSIEPQLEQSVSFGYIDCDSDQDFARDTGVRNVPSIAYYSGTKLLGLAIGTSQDIAGNIKRLMRGEFFDQTNVLSGS